MVSYAALSLLISCRTTMTKEQFPNHLLGPVSSDQSLEDMKEHPIWLWGIQVNNPEDADGVNGGDETGMRAWLGEPNVTPEMMNPMILLRVKGTDLWAAGLYDHKRKLIDAIGMYGSEGYRPTSWYIETPGIPITYVAVPKIDGQPNIEFKAKNRQRHQALMVGKFTAEEEQKQYEQEIANNSVSANSPTTMIRNDPKLLMLANCFLKRVAQDIFADKNGVVFVHVAGSLEDEDPDIFRLLLKDATTEKVTFLIPGRATIIENYIVDSESGESGIMLIITNVQKHENEDEYTIEGYWYKKDEQYEFAGHRIVKAEGNWIVKDN